MFDIGSSELLLILIVAVVVIGPKDLPRALRLVGRWVGKARKMSNHFRAGVDAMIREAELEEMEKKWAEQNAKIMAQFPQTDLSAHEMTPLPSPAPTATSHVAEGVSKGTEHPADNPSGTAPADEEPQLPLR